MTLLQNTWSLALFVYNIVYEVHFAMYSALVSGRTLVFGRRIAQMFLGKFQIRELTPLAQAARAAALFSLGITLKFLVRARH